MKEAIELGKKLASEGMEGFKKYYGTYAGIVYDNKDPLSLARLRIKVPDIYGENVPEVWALPKTFTGKNEGAYIVPQIGAPIWVTFQKGGDSRFPLWEPGWMVEDNKISGSPDLKVFQTKSGNKSEFDDENELIRLTSAQDKVIELSDVISLGTKTKSKEAAALGDTLLKKLEAIVDITSTIATEAAIIIVPTGVGPSGVPTNSAKFTQAVADLTKLKAELKEILSEIVTLD